MPTSVNKFAQPDHYEHDIANAETGNRVGTIRLKPSSILWKPKGAHQFHSASLEEFTAWMATKKLVAK